MNTLIYCEGLLVTFCFMNASLPKMKNRISHNLYQILSTIFLCRSKMDILIDESSDGEEIKNDKTSSSVNNHSSDI